MRYCAWIGAALALIAVVPGLGGLDPFNQPKEPFIGEWKATTGAILSIKPHGQLELNNHQSAPPFLSAIGNKGTWEKENGRLRLIGEVIGKTEYEVICAYCCIDDGQILVLTPDSRDLTMHWLSRVEH